MQVRTLACEPNDNKVAGSNPTIYHCEQDY